MRKTTLALLLLLPSFNAQALLTTLNFEGNTHYVFDHFSQGQIALGTPLTFSISYENTFPNGTSSNHANASSLNLSYELNYGHLYYSSTNSSNTWYLSLDNIGNINYFSVNDFQIELNHDYYFPDQGPWYYGVDTFFYDGWDYFTEGFLLPSTLTPNTPVPEPTGLWLLVTGLIALKLSSPRRWLSSAPNKG